MTPNDLISGLQRILMSFKCECHEDHWQWLKLPCNRCAGLSNLQRLSVFVTSREDLESNYTPVVS